jgi:RNA polymerase sigma-70 factor (ECF subfamily)
MHRPLRQFAYSILKLQEEAEELVCDLFIKIWNNREKLLSVNAPKLYLYTAVKNMAYTRAGRLKKRLRISADDWLVEMDSIYFDPEKLVMTEEVFRQIRNAINELPPRCRIIFKLIKEDGFKYKEVAELLQLSVKTVEAQMAIALRRIGKCMHLDLKNTTLQRGIKKS